MSGRVLASRTRFWLAVGYALLVALLLAAGLVDYVGQCGVPALLMTSVKAGRGTRAGSPGYPGRRLHADPRRHSMTADDSTPSAGHERTDVESESDEWAAVGRELASLELKGSAEAVSEAFWTVAERIDGGESVRGEDVREMRMALERAELITEEIERADTGSDE